MRELYVTAALWLAACGGGGSSDPDATPPIDGRDIDAGITCGPARAITTLHEDTRAVRGSPAVQDGHVYWMTASRTQPVVGSGMVHRLDLSSDDVTAIANGLQRPWGITVRGTALYWVNFSDSNTTNGNVESLSLLGGSPMAVASPESPSGDVFVDDDAIYFTVRPPSPYGIRRAALNGGATSTVVTSEVLTQSPLVVDGTLYWLEGSEDPTSDRVLKRALPDGAPVALATIADVGQASSLAVASGTVYWSTGRGRGANGMVLAVPTGGGPVSEVVPGQPFGVDGLDGEQLLVDATHVYVATGHDGHDDGDNLDRIVRARRSGGGVETVAIATGTIRGFTMDNCNLYWIDDVAGAPRLMTAGK